MLTFEVSRTLTPAVRMLTVMDTVGDRIKRCREAVKPKLTQQALAVAIGVTRSAIAQVEGGLSNSLNAENITKAAQFLGKNPLWLATGEGPENASNAVNDALDAMPDANRQQTFDFILYQFEKTKDIYSERPGEYANMIERIKADMERRKANEQKPADRLRETPEDRAPKRRSKTRKLI